jgi:predicted GIY-YIG superfamily endonuclease
MSRVYPGKSKEECRKIALKYNTIKELKANDPYVYGRIHAKRWADELLSHIKRLGSQYRKGVYKYTFPDGSVYYGITQNFKTRHNQHMGKIKNRRTTVTKYMEQTGLIPEYLQLTNYMNTEIASKIEDGLVENDREMGIKVLNKVKAGGIGRQKEISDEELLNSMEGYEYVDQWRKENRNYYDVAKNRNKYNKNYLTSLYKKGGLNKRQTNLKWDFDTIKKYIEENNIDSRSGKNGLYRKNQTAYNYALKQGWLDDLI